MPASPRAKRIGILIGFVFLFFILLNAVFHTLAVHAGLYEHGVLHIVPDGTSIAVRLLLFLLGLAISWFGVRLFFQGLIGAEFDVSSSVNAALLLLSLLALTTAMLAFLGFVSWYWLPFLFLVLLLFSVFILWRLIGGAFTVLSVLVTIVAIALTWSLAS